MKKKYENKLCLFVLLTFKLRGEKFTWAIKSYLKYMDNGILWKNDMN